MEIMKWTQIKKQYPNEWVLIANPELDTTRQQLISGIPIYHSKDKKEVCYIGRDKTSAYQKITIVYTGELSKQRKITGIFNRV